MVHHGQEKRFVADKRLGGRSRASVAPFPVLCEDEIDRAAPPLRDALKVGSHAVRIGAEHDHEPIDAHISKLGDGALRQGKASYTDLRFGNGVRTVQPASIAGVIRIAWGTRQKLYHTKNTSRAGTFCSTIRRWRPGTARTCLLRDVRRRLRCPHCGRLSQRLLVGYHQAPVPNP